MTMTASSGKSCLLNCSEQSSNSSRDFLACPAHFDENKIETPLLPLAAYLLAMEE
jgi:hypothetical protein